jgi:hypothetical protein
VRLAAALVESGVLVAVGAMFFSGSIAHSEEPPPLPIRLGPGAAPYLLVVGAYAIQRLTRPRGWAFTAAFALACSLGAALRPGLPLLRRPGEAALALLVGAIAGGLVMPINDEGDSLIGAGVKPWRELYFASLLVFFGTLPAAITGGFVLALPTIALGLWILARGAWHDLRQLARGGPRAGALVRLLLGLGIGLLGLGLAAVTPLFSFVRGPWSGDR